MAGTTKHHEADKRRDFLSCGDAKLLSPKSGTRLSGTVPPVGYSCLHHAATIALSERSSCSCHAGVAEFRMAGSDTAEIIVRRFLNYPDLA